MAIDRPGRGTTQERRFACTQCGKCCNRSPEVELSEAAPLSDVFAFRLMFRLYWLPRHLADYRELREKAANSEAVFYQKKRLLSAFAAHKAPARLRPKGKAVEHMKYLMISALALETSPGACSALDGNRCGIHDRRPLSCRSVPFHYSRVEALAESDLQTFVETPGYRCDTVATAPIVLEAGRIVDVETLEVRAKALALAQHDRRWSDAIMRRMKAAPSANAPLPSLEEVEANAPFGATTTSMRVAWQIAADAGIMRVDEYRTLVGKQLAIIEPQLAADGCSANERQTLLEMQTEYRAALTPVTAVTLDGSRAGAISAP